jgi:hypothetical protein
MKLASFKRALDVSHQLISYLRVCSFFDLTISLGLINKMVQALQITFIAIGGL